MTATEPDREKSLQDYRKKLLEHKEVESRLKESKHLVIKCLCRFIDQTVILL